MMRAALRSISAAFTLSTAGYALLCASPFTYHDFIRSNMFGIAAVARWHPAAYWVWLLIALIDLRLAAAPRPAASFVFAGVWGAVGVLDTVHPILTARADDERSLLVAVLAVVPLVWLAAIDHRSAAPYLSSPRHGTVDRDVEETEARLVIAALGSAVVLAIGSAALVPVLMRGQFEPDLLSLGLAAGLVWTFAGVSALFCAAFLAVALILRVVFRASMAVQYGVVLAVSATAIAVGIDRTVCAALGVAGVWRVVVPAGGALAIAATWGGLGLERAFSANVRLSSPMQLVFGTPRAISAVRLGLFLSAMLAATYAAWAVSRWVDWDFLLLSVTTFAIWLATCAYLYRAAPARTIGTRALAALCLVPLALWQGTRAVDARSSDVRRRIDRYAVYNGSLRLADGLLSRRTAAAPAFVRFLRDNSGLTNVDVKPVSLDFVAALGSAPRQPLPHVFLFVVDSLRPDYLAPYNAAVTFTPRLAELAADSIVFRNTITRYGATGLSVPAIWSGAVGPHRQYVTPFWPMNTLEKLLIANSYRRLMSVDVLMDQLLRPWSETVALDRGRRTLDDDLCGTLEELQTRFPADARDGPPIFAYSNPQNLHLSNLMSASVPAGETYPGFHPPYAARVRAIDRCLGRFVDFLKGRQVYDRSLIIVTSDHGELLGEEGRWGHAYYLFPQILQIPLIVHVPRTPMADVSDRLDTESLAFSTDIAPIVYAALGYPPRAANPLMGEPLIQHDAVRDRRRRRGDYVVEASYSAVYGVVRNNATRLYIIDAMSGAEYAYGRGRSGAWHPVPVDRSIREPAQRLIREHVDEIRRVYRLPAYR